MTTPAEQLDRLTTAWRSRHGPEVQRRRSTHVVETVMIAFEDGSLAELSRKAGESAWTVTRDPDTRLGAPVDQQLSTPQETSRAPDVADGPGKPMGLS